MVLLSWDEQFIKVIEQMKNNKNIILYGGGGVGKSYMLNKLNKLFKNHIF